MPSLDVRIKWPNDLYLDGLKVGGILCTSTYKSKKFNISAGKYSSLLCVIRRQVLHECMLWYIHSFISDRPPSHLLKLSHVWSYYYILKQSSNHKGFHWGTCIIFVGIGLNIDNQKPTTCLNAALQRLGYAANQLQREDIISAFFNKFEVFHDIFLSQGDHFSSTSLLVC